MSTMTSDVRTSGPRIEQKLVGGGYVRNAWYMAGWAEELSEPGKLLGRTLLDQPVVMFRTADGALVALEDRCPHRFAPLSLGKVLPGDKLQCPYHGLELDAGGMCTHNPHGAKNIPSRARVKSWPIVEKHQGLWIWMGEGAGDPARIPNFSVLDNVPEFCSTKLDGIKMAADWRLIIDNLLDLSHISYLHPGMLGNADTINSSIDVTLDGTDIIIERLAKNGTCPGMTAMMWPGVPPKVDIFTRMRWMVPSYISLFTGACELDQPWETGTGIHALHFLTPETARSTHYWFTAVRFGLRSKDPAHNREIQDKIGKGRRHAFVIEDAPVIEAQQRVIDTATRPLDPVVLSVDAGTMHFRRAVEKLIEAEAH